MYLQKKLLLPIRIWAILVRIGLTLTTEENNEPDITGQRNKRNKVPPSTLAYIVQTTHCYRN